MSTAVSFAFDNTYARELEGLYVPWQPAKAPEPQLLHLNRALADELGLQITEADAAALFSGNALPAGATPIAQAYAGHQFGRFSPQLGDGRALLLGEVIDTLRAGGATSHSRARAARRSRAAATARPRSGRMLREVLFGEAMHALGVPTTRVLAAVATGEPRVPRAPCCPARC